jgi:hypothetical protein
MDKNAFITAALTGAASYAISMQMTGDQQYNAGVAAVGSLVDDYLKTSSLEQGVETIIPAQFMKPAIVGAFQYGVPYAMSRYGGPPPMQLAFIGAGAGFAADLVAPSLQ